MQRLARDDNRTFAICFPAGTLISTKTGCKAIEDIQPGDQVYAQSPDTGNKDLKTVTRIFTTQTQEIVHIYVNGEEIETTLNHPFYVENQGWVKAGELNAGDRLRLLSGAAAPIEKVELEELTKPITTYNFEVEDWHSYYVSAQGVLVHNKGNPCADGGTGKNVTSNKGNVYNNTPSSNHSATTGNPIKGEPNSSVDILDKNGDIKTRRWFGPDGNQIRDLDYTNHGNPKTHPEWPHEHGPRIP